VSFRIERAVAVNRYRAEDE